MDSDDIRDAMESRDVALKVLTACQGKTLYSVIAACLIVAARAVKEGGGSLLTFMDFASEAWKAIQDGTIEEEQRAKHRFN